MSTYEQQCRDDAVSSLVKLVRDYDQRICKSSDDPELKVIVAQIRAMGHAASFFGGFDGMTALHDAAEAATGKRNDIGYRLNHLWDGIGGWLA